MRATAAALALLLALPAGAETLVAARTIRAQEVLGPADVAVVRGEVTGALTDPAEALGLEARVSIYAGRPIRAGDLGPPAIVERNAIVRLRYESGPLVIAAEGRALDRAAAGDVLRVMNLSSRTIVSGLVAPNGIVHVSSTAP